MPLFDTTVESVTTTGLMTYIGNIITAVLGWIPDFLDAALDSPVVLVFIGIAVIYAVIRMAKKLLHF